MSSRPFIGVLLLLAAFAPHASGADGERRAGDRFSSLTLPRSLQSVENDRLSKNYEGTRCVDFKDRATHVDLGTVCESGSKAFLKDMGVLIPSDDVRPLETLLTEAVVATPMAQYKLADATGLVAKTAKVDCDPSNNAIYRPTATCQIYIAKTSPETFLYGNFFLKDHTSRRKGIPVKTVTDIWRRILSVAPS